MIFSFDFFDVVLSVPQKWVHVVNLLYLFLVNSVKPGIFLFKFANLFFQSNESVLDLCPILIVDFLMLFSSSA